MKEIFKPLCKLAQQINDAVIPDYEYLVINRKTENYNYYTWSGLVDLVNNEGINNFIVFNIKDKIQLSNEIVILKEREEESENL